MIRLIYISQSTSANMNRDIQSILTVSRRNNPELGLTGMLFTYADNFLQILEGPDEAVHALWSYIQTDRRHKNLQLLSHEQIENNRCAHWVMAHYETATTITPEAHAVIDALNALGNGQNLAAKADLCQALLQTAQIQSMVESAT